MCRETEKGRTEIKRGKVNERLRRRSRQETKKERRRKSIK